MMLKGLNVRASGCCFRNYLDYFEVLRGFPGHT